MIMFLILKSAIYPCLQYIMCYFLGIWRSSSW